MGGQKVENLHRDKYQKDISEDRWGDREWRTYIGIPSKQERGREEQSESRDLSNKSLKTDGETKWRTYIGMSQREREGKREKGKEHRSE